MFNLRFFSDQFGYSQRDEAVKQAEQRAHFGGVGNVAVGIGDFGDKQGNRQSDACRHADQQQIEVGDGVVDPELKQMKINASEGCMLASCNPAQESIPVKR